MGTRANPLSERLAPIFTTYGTALHIAKGQLLFSEGEIAQSLYYIVDGRIQLSKSTADGQELTFSLCGKNRIIEDVTLFAADSKFTLTAKATAASNVLAVDKHQFEQLLLRDAKLSADFLQWLSNEQRKTNTKVRDLVVNGKKGALYSTLIRMVNSYGVAVESGYRIDAPFTNQEIANFCGTSREVVNRLLAELKKANKLSIEKGIIFVHDLHYLKSEIDCENCPVEWCNID